MSEAPTINAVAQWFGSNRENAEAVGKALGKLAWCGVPFTGGASELQFIDTRSGVANDLHRHLVNLGRVIRDQVLCAQAADVLGRTLYHESELEAAQRRCIERDRAVGRGLMGEAIPAADVAPDVGWAVDYFVVSWMGPGAASGKNTEFSRYFASRWSATGGASVVKFRSAVESLLGWKQILERWEFRVSDAFLFLDECKDEDGHGIYCDPPWVLEGEEYRHRFTERDHRELARKLGTFKRTRVVVRYGVCDLVRMLYPTSRWRWVETVTKNQDGNDVNEALIIGGGAAA